MNIQNSDSLNNNQIVNSSTNIDKNKKLNEKANDWLWVENLPEFSSSINCPYNLPKKWYENLFQLLNVNFFFEKFFVVIFSCIIFGLVARRIQEFNDVYSFLGITLLLVTLYVETLIIRDHIWVLEIAIPDAQRIKNALFTTQSLSKTRWRKILVMIFTAFVFTHVYFKMKRSEIIAFLGIVLFITILYYELLQIRDDVKSLLDATQIQYKVKVNDNTKDHH